MRLTCFLAVFFSCSLFLSTAFAQKTTTPVKKDNTSIPASQKSTARQLIDSLELVTIIQSGKLDSLDLIIENERLASTDLREQVIKLDDYRKKLEDNIHSFKGENLKLNQSNRILIVFNSLVAVLLITSLVFVLKKINRKNATPVSLNNSSSARPTEQVKFTNIEDKLIELERLGKLREKELLSEEEFVVEKQKILGK